MQEDTGKGVKRKRVDTDTEKVTKRRKVDTDMTYSGDRVYFNEVPASNTVSEHFISLRDIITVYT